MALSSSWIHGNALTLETPANYDENGNERARLLLTPQGPGAWVSCERGFAESWMHLPIPTINASVGTLQLLELVSFILLFRCWSSRIHSVHVYDGFQKIQEFNGADGNGLWLTGNFLVKNKSNSFVLGQPHVTRMGIGIASCT